MSQSIVLKQQPRIEFIFNQEGFELIDQQTKRHSGFYNYADLQSVDVNHGKHPRFIKWLRIVTWVLNGVPLLAEASSYKKANMMLDFKSVKLGIWLTDITMAKKARAVKEVCMKKMGANKA